MKEALLIGALIGFAVVVAFLLSRRGSSRSPDEQTETRKSAAEPLAPNAPIYDGMRQQALTLTREKVGLEPAPAWGVLMETTYSSGTATLLSLSDGTASLYYSSGGGIIGGSGHETVRQAAKSFVQEAARHLTRLSLTNTFPLPPTGRTIFYVLTDKGVLTAEADENDLGEQRHALSPLFHAGHVVITQLRLVSEPK